VLHKLLLVCFKLLVRLLTCPGSNANVHRSHLENVFISHDPSLNKLISAGYLLLQSLAFSLPFIHLHYREYERIYGEYERIY